MLKSDAGSLCAGIITGEPGKVFYMDRILPRPDNRTYLSVAPQQTGYTLIQILIVILIAGILSALGIGRLSGFMKQKTLQGEVQSQLAFLQQGRSIAIKKNLQVGVVFDSTKKALVLFEDANGDGVMQAGEISRTCVFSKDILMGPATKTPPLTGPVGGTIPTSGLTGTWTSNLLFAKDPMATPNVGAAYLHHQKLDAWTACLVRSTVSQQIQAFIWDGGSWRLL